MQLLKIRTALRTMVPGDILEIWDTDPGTHREITELGDNGGSEYLGNLRDPEGYTRYYLRKG